MIAVFHNRAKSCGCLAHISHCTVDQKVLFGMATESIKTMYEVSGKPASADIYLLAGRAFVYQSPFAQENPQVIDYSEHLFEILNPKYAGGAPSYVVYDYCAAQYSQALYCPDKDILYLLSDKEQEVLRDHMEEGKAKWLPK